MQRIEWHCKQLLSTLKRQTNINFYFLFSLYFFFRVDFVYDFVGFTGKVDALGIEMNKKKIKREGKIENIHRKVVCSYFKSCIDEKS